MIGGSREKGGAEPIFKISTCVLRNLRVGIARFKDKDAPFFAQLWLWDAFNIK